MAQCGPFPMDPQSRPSYSHNRQEAREEAMMEGNKVGGVALRAIDSIADVIGRNTADVLELTENVRAVADSVLGAEGPRKEDGDTGSFGTGRIWQLADSASAQNRAVAELRTQIARLNSI